MVCGYAGLKVPGLLITIDSEEYEEASEVERLLSSKQHNCEQQGLYTSK